MMVTEIPKKKNPTPNKKRILVIDDDENIRRLLRTILELEGYQVIEASDGGIGLREFEKSPADLVITDLIMPGKEGIETIRDLRQKSPDVKIIAISGGGRIGPESYLKMAEGVGALHTMKKPFELVELVEAVAKVLKMDPR